MKVFSRRAAALRRTCPTCNATAGRPCVKVRGVTGYDTGIGLPMRTIHPRRYDALDQRTEPLPPATVKAKWPPPVEIGPPDIGLHEPEFDLEDDGYVTVWPAFRVAAGDL